MFIVFEKAFLALEKVITETQADVLIFELSK